MEIARFPRPGDHIYAPRALSYSHHGIYLGHGEVSRLRTPMECEPSSGGPGIEVIQLHQFLGNSCEWRLYRYGVSEKELNSSPRGTCSLLPADDIEVVLNRARKALRDGFGQFNLVGNSCEDFAVYCKTGERPPASGHFMAAMGRVTAVRRAASLGYTSPIVYAGCIFGWFTASDFTRREFTRLEDLESTPKLFSDSACDVSIPESESSDLENDLDLKALNDGRAEAVTAANA